ncbi:uncharacterized protein EV420DRAFT_1763236 [Desarmillaria tabescens]|uniref:Uncharacterized protein n=1 Tax=Armillaria tabescens TaxID=1929756 RepID=A0AA39KEJ5_ARMTA|nr:uncharacterized protein EV420DRAFT_1763236 [Desarmillaria tabescens]KAK0459522.1 hypothetical protein EV420DRAFT_1763236 [Desarmillaria tabescens]
MEVQAAASALSESALSLKTETVDTSLRHVLEAVKLLDISSPSLNIIEKIGSRLRKPLLPLYQHCTDPALRFCSATLNFISVKKVQPALLVQANSLVVAWQATQSALISGVLDFIERNPTNENKKSIATELYTVLCDGYFLSTPTERLTVGVNLAYILLTESASLNENRLVLQDPKLLGAKRIGATLAGCKDYLAIEALLELFASILPPTTKGANDKRRRFLQLVFDPELFACGAQLIKSLSSPSTIDWETLSIEIITTLSKSDITFPQPFKIASLQVADTFPNVDNTIYLDNKGFTSNIDENGTYETFHVPFANVKKIRLNVAASSLHTVVTVHLTAFPIIDRTTGSQNPNQNAVLVFEITSTEKERFVKGLKARKMGPNIVPNERKASKLNVDLPLDFTSNGQSFPEKAGRVLGVEASSDYHFLQTPSVSALHGTLPASADDLKSIAVGGDQDDAAPKPPKTRRAQKQKAVESDDEIHEIPPIPVAKAMRHSTKPRSSEQHPPVPAERVTRALPQSREHTPNKSFPTAQVHRVHFGRTEHTSPNKAIDVSEPEEDKSKRATKIASTRSMTTRNSPSKKRQRTAEVENAEDQDSRPSKRLRPQNAPKTEATRESKSPVFKKSVIAPRRYKRKGRTSSPTPSTAADMEYDKIPSVSSPKQATSNMSEQRPVSAPYSTRVSAMRGRGGKALGKGVSVKAEPPPIRKAKGTNRNTVKDDQKELKPTRRSERAKKVVDKTTKANAVVEHRSPTPVKSGPQNSSLETNADMNTIQSTIQIALGPYLTDASPTDPDSMEMEMLTDFIVPVKIEDPTSDAPSAPSTVAKNVTMIDLTLDDSPPRTTKPKKDKQRQNPAHAFTLDVGQESSRSDDSMAKKLEKSLDVSPKVLGATRRAVEEAANESTILDQHSGSVETRTRTEKPIVSRQPSIRQRQSIRTSDSILNLDRNPMIVHTTVPRIRPLTVTKPDASLGVSSPTLPSSVKAPAGISSRPHDSNENTDPINHTRWQETPISLSERKKSPIPVKLLVEENSSAKAKTPHSKQKFDVPLMTMSSRGVPLFDKTNAPEFSFRTEQYSPPKGTAKSSKHGMFCCLSIPASDYCFAARPTREDKENSEQRQRRYEARHDNRGGNIDHDIIQILSEMQDVIVDKISRRFDHVKTDVRAGRNSILREAALELDKMRTESIQHFRSLFDFESEYSSCIRNYTNGLEDLHKVNHQITRRIGEILHTHDRRSLSKVFPALSPPPPRVLRPSF